MERSNSQCEMGATEWECWADNTTKARRGARLPSNSGVVDARRLENAVWRLWNMERMEHEDGNHAGSRLSRLGSSASLSNMAAVAEEDCEENGRFQDLLQNKIGGQIDFKTLRFPASRTHCRYDDLPTFPVRPNFANFDNELHAASECVVFDGCPEDPYHPSNTPIYQTSTFVQPSCSEFGPYDYTRSGNPTRTALEKHAAMLEKAAAAFAFSSGMAALHTVFRLLKKGDEVLLNEDIYGGTHRLLTQDAINCGIIVTFTDTTDLALVESQISPKTKLIHTESPSNPRMRITDLTSLANIAHKNGVLLSVDSTMMPPVICKPLTLGADIVTHSATKFFSGHADCTAGLVCVRDPELAHRIAFLQNCEGTALAPFECFLLLRGIKTMYLRVKRAQETAEEVAAFLMRHPCVKEVYFPGPGGCDKDRLVIHRSQAIGQGSMISLTTGCCEFSRRFCDACRIFKTTVSFGSVNSLCEMPCTMSHASIPSEKRTIAADLVRLSIGIEDVRDLIKDLSRALDAAAGIEASPKDHAPAGGYDSIFENLPVLPSLPSSDPRAASPVKRAGATAGSRSQGQLPILREPEPEDIAKEGEAFEQRGAAKRLAPLVLLASGTLLASVALRLLRRNT
eukprot:TRINITY_DN4050_c0_g1_i1.p1 TRINITY_DN4050_c0_g1~~TRINITY_DN4050_c0_g1_i1.p1  ORF type:complete len:643 (-),score=120.98 TRINITY_DN4050_c0_g1_i1:67-1941(-)